MALINGLGAKGSLSCHDFAVRQASLRKSATERVSRTLDDLMTAHGHKSGVILPKYRLFCMVIDQIQTVVTQESLHRILAIWKNSIELILGIMGDSLEISALSLLDQRGYCSTLIFNNW